MGHVGDQAVAFFRFAGAFFFAVGFFAGAFLTGAFAPAHDANGTLLFGCEPIDDRQNLLKFVTD